MKRPKKSSAARRRMRALCGLLGLLFLAMLSGTLVFLQTPVQAIENPIVQVVEQKQFDRYLTETGADDGGLPDQIGGNGSRIVNILLVGQDRRENEGRTRSDTMLLCTFNKRTRELVLTSFLRDLYVPIPGHGSDRINAAYVYGGMELLEDTLEENFDLTIDGTVEVDFSQFSQIVDLLGGVEMELRSDEAAIIQQETAYETMAGLQTLNGDQALAYSRIRKLDADGDFSRTNRQRKVLSALLNTYRDAELPVLLKLVNELLPMITTDLNPLEIVGYALELFPMLSGAEIRQQHVPASGSYSDQMIDGMAVLVPDLEAAREMLSQSLLGL